MIRIPHFWFAALAAVSLACVLGCADAWGLEGSVNLASCTVVVDRCTDIPADGTHSATVRVVLRDARQRPVAGHPLQITVTGSCNSVRQPDSLTDAQGVATAQIASTRAETKTVLAVLQPGVRPKVLAQTPILEFVQAIPLDDSQPSDE